MFDSFFSLAVYFLVVIPSAIIHEYAHGWASFQQGDNTAQYAGRLTLDPRAHIDRWGTILLPLILFFISGGNFMFAYAKPVPYNPYNLRNHRWGPALVAAAGPLSNLLLAFLFGSVLRWMHESAAGRELLWSGSGVVFYGYLIISIVVRTNIVLALFNLLPAAPLDGSKILYALLPSPQAERVAEFLERYRFIILMAVLFFLFDWLMPVINWLYKLFTSASY